MSTEARKPLKEVISISFNQDASCLCCATTSGFRVFTTEPFTEPHRRDFDSSGIGIATMLFRSNIFALVGGGPVPKYPPNKVMIWDDHQCRAIGELAFRTPVKAVCMRKERIAVAVEQKVYVYDLEDLRLMHQIETAPNPDGLVAMSTATDASMVLACPGLQVGQLRVDVMDTKRVHTITAHNSSLAAVTVCPTGKLIATASEKGTLIRIFSSMDGSKMREVRRGSDPARIHSLAFSKEEDPEWLAASSDKGTVHVFSLTGRTSRGGDATAQAQAQAQDDAVVSSEETSTSTSPSKMSSSKARLRMSTFTKLVPTRMGGAYLASEWSWAQFRLPDCYKTVVAFGKNGQTLLIASVTGAFHRISFSPDRKGSADQDWFSIFMEEESPGSMT